MSEVMEVSEAPKASAQTKIDIPLRTLQKALSAVGYAIERKTTIPILSAVHVEQRADVLELAGTNLDLSIVVQVATPNAKAAAPFLLPALKTGEYAKLLSGEVVTLTVQDERAALRCGKSYTKLPSLPLKSFPAIAGPAGDNGLAISQDRLSRALRFVDFAVSREESRYTLKAALLKIGGGKLVLVATDGHRLARYTVASDGPEMTVLLPAALVETVAKLIDKESTAPVLLEASEKDIFAALGDSSGSVRIACRKLAGEFPNYEAVMPRTMAASVRVDAAEMAGAVKRALSFAGDFGAVRLAVSNEEIKLHSATADTGETDEVVAVRQASTGEDFAEFRVGFCGNYLLDAFSRLDGPVEMRFSALSSSNSMMIFAEPKEGETFEYVVMPLRIDL